MKYIADTLGIDVNCKSWNGSVPFYLTDGYAFQDASLGGMACLFVKPKNELPALDTVKKHLAKIAEIADMPLVLEINALNARQRKALIRDHIPFVMDGVQLYLPFMGVLLQERYPAPSPQSEKLMPTSQLVLFHYIYQKKREMYASGLAGFLGVSAMQVTRAVKQLSALGLFKTQKDGVQIVCTGTEEGAALFDKAKPYIQNPAGKKIYVEKDALPQGLPLAGFSALAEYTMLNPPNLTTFAFGGKAGELSGTKALVDAEEQAEVEFWRYPPEMLSARLGFADPLSLWATLPDGDPRTESAKDELLAAAWE
jgi:DNA-binding MarR family transcriptional regulator